MAQAPKRRGRPPKAKANPVAEKIAALMADGYTAEEAAKFAKPGDPNAKESGYRSGPPIQDKRPLDGLNLELRPKHQAWLLNKAEQMGVPVERVLEKLIAEVFAHDPDRTRGRLPRGKGDKAGSVRRADFEAEIGG